MSTPRKRKARRKVLVNAVMMERTQMQVPPTPPEPRPSPYEELTASPRELHDWLCAMRPTAPVGWSIGPDENPLALFLGVKLGGRWLVGPFTITDTATSTTQPTPRWMRAVVEQLGAGIGHHVHAVELLELLDRLEVTV